MKKVLTKVISILTSTALSASVLLGTPLSEFDGMAAEVSAATIDQAYVLDRIASLKTKFPNGSYFTVDGKKCCSTTYCEGSHERSKLGNILSQNPNAKDVSTTVFSQTNRYSCFAFASYAFAYIFGVDPLNKSDVTATGYNVADSESLLPKLKPGDLVQYYGNGSHYAIFLYYDTATKKAHFYESNKYGNCLVSYDSSRVWNWEQVNRGRTKMTVWHYNNYDEGTPQPAGEHYIVDKNYNGSDPKNIRASKSSSSALLGTIPKNTVCWVTEISGSGSNKWGKVTYNGVTGYINLYYSVTTDDHQWSGWTTTKAATCTDSGTQKRSCGCGKTEEQTIAATGHSYGSWQTVTAATCTAAGTEQRTCSKCGNRETRSIAATGHKYKDEVIPPTPTSDGYTKHTCTVCGHSYNDNYIPATGASGTIRIDNTTVGIGQTVKIPVYIDDTKVMGISIDVKFDPAVLKYKGYSDKVFDLVEENADNASNGSVSLVCANTSDLVGGKIIVLSFETAASKSCTTKISVSTSDATDGENQVVLTASEATVTVSSALLGDVTGDGKITTQDAIWVLQSVAKKRTLTAAQTSAADVTKDGKISTQDAIWILQSIVGKRVL